MNHREIAENKTRQAFHGLSDKQWEECKNSFPYSEIPHIALAVHKAIKETDVCLWETRTELPPSKGKKYYSEAMCGNYITMKSLDANYCPYCGRKIKEVGGTE